MTEAPPLLLLVGPPGHGVVQYAADLATSLRRLDDRAEVASAADIAEAMRLVGGTPRVHLHVTDRLFGRSPEEAADSIAKLAARTTLTITVHDVPQTSDGTMMDRRIGAYSRFFAAAHAVVVNSRHEQLLVAEFLPRARQPHAIPLGARVAAAPSRPRPESVTDARERDLVVLLAGYVYPGKGHAGAVRSAGSAADRLRAAGERVDAVIVRAIGRPSAGHEGDVTLLRRDAERLGVEFEVTGFLEDDEFARRIREPGIPLAAHEHVSASRSMLDWAEAGRRPLVVESRYAAEMDGLRPGTMTRYAPASLEDHLVAAFRAPDLTWLPPGTPLGPTLDDAAADYLAWWAGLPR